MKKKIPPLKPVTRILCDLQPLKYQTLSLLYLLRHFKNKMKNKIPKFLAAVTRKRHFLMIKKCHRKINLWWLLLERIKSFLFKSFDSQGQFWPDITDLTWPVCLVFPHTSSTVFATTSTSSSSLSSLLVDLRFLRDDSPFSWDLFGETNFLKFFAVSSLSSTASLTLFLPSSISPDTPMRPSSSDFNNSPTSSLPMSSDSWTSLTSSST